MIKKGGTFVRCHCCGEWLLLYIWDTSKRIYHELEFIWDMGTQTYSLLPMSEETRAARQAAQE